MLKATRRLPPINPENLDPNHRAAERLAAALQLNHPPGPCQLSEGGLCQIWRQPDKASAAAILYNWVDRAAAFGISMPVKFAKPLALYRQGILVYKDYPISAGPLEVTNSKIKTMRRPAYGFRDQGFFKLKILAFPETRYAVVG